jgi:site-specific DNA-methyltransferase (adenine-specific)
MNDINLILGDCLTELKKIHDNSVDLVLTSPPYNKNGFRGKRDTSRGHGRWTGADISYGEYSDDIEESKYKNWQVSVLDECYRIIKDTGSIFYNHKVRRSSGSASHPMEWILRSKARFYQQIIWDRGSGPDHNLSYLFPTTELVFWLVKGSPKCHKDKDYATEVWRIPATPTDDNHPAPFPKKLCRAAISTVTDKFDVVLDPFCGSGTVGVVCKETGRNFTGIEINPNYVKIAKERIDKVVGNVFNNSLIDLINIKNV